MLYIHACKTPEPKSHLVFKIPKIVKLARRIHKSKLDSYDLKKTSKKKEAFDKTYTSWWNDDDKFDSDEEF